MVLFECNCITGLLAILKTRESEMLNVWLRGGEDTNRTKLGTVVKKQAKWEAEQRRQA